MEEYGNTIYKMGYYILKNDQDAQDVLQETLIKYMQKAPKFDSFQQEKAWLLKVVGNLCKDMLRFQKRNRFISIDEVQKIEDSFTSMYGGGVAINSEIITEIFALKEKYKQVIFLHYYEGYSVKEIAEITGSTESAVKKRLQRGKEELRRTLLNNRRILGKEND